MRPGASARTDGPAPQLTVIGLLPQRQMNKTVLELGCSQPGRAQFGILNYPADRHALRREQHPAEGDALLLPPGRDL